MFVLLYVVNQMFAQQVKEVNVSTEPIEVTVFSSGAQVTRKKSIELQQGKSIVKFMKLSPYLVGKSILLKGFGDVTILSVNYQFNFLDSLKRVKETENILNKVETIENQIKIELANLEVLKEQTLLLQENRTFKPSANSNVVNSLKDALSFYQEQFLYIKQKEIEVSNKIEILKKELEAQIKQYNSIGDKKVEYYAEVLALVEVKKDTKIDFELSYFAENATWFPSYDIRADELSEPLKIIYKANIQQNTKENWSNVKLSLSTTDPILGNTATKLIPYQLHFNSTPPKYISKGNEITGKITDENGDPLIGALITVEGYSISAVSDIEGKYSITVPSKPDISLKVKYIGYNSQTRVANNGTEDFVLKEQVQNTQEVAISSEFLLTVRKNSTQVVNGVSSEQIKKTPDRSTADVLKRVSGGKKYAKESDIVDKSVTNSPVATTFEIKTLYTLPSTNKLITVEIERIQMETNYEYYAAPKADKDAFLLASFTNWSQYNLLDGEASIYFENTYVGKTLLDISNLNSDTLTVSLGRDKNVSISREPKKDFTKKQFFGFKKEVSKGWNITVKNNKKSNIKLVLHDQVPVSITEDIEVLVDEISNAEYNKDSGELVWKMDLQQGQKNEYLIKYRVKAPKSVKTVIE
jgi:hypothetical protein